MDNKSSKIKPLDLYYCVNLTSKFFNTEYHCKTILNIKFEALISLYKCIYLLYSSVLPSRGLYMSTSKLGLEQIQYLKNFSKNAFTSEASGRFSGSLSQHDLIRSCQCSSGLWFIDIEGLRFSSVIAFSRVVYNCCCICSAASIPNHISQSIIPSAYISAFLS